MTKAKIKTAAKKPAAKKASAKKPLPARILFVLDRSQSMGSVKNETITGFNAFMADQRKIKAPTRISLVQFNHEYSVTYADLDVNDAVDLTPVSYQPGGWTALYDAVGYTITANKASTKKGELTILAILTDGEENRSREYTFPAVQALIKEAQDLGWEVTFLGANINAQAVGGSLGIKAANTMTFDANAKGMADSYMTMSASASNYRGVIAVGAANFLNQAGEIDAQAMYNSLKSKDDVKSSKQP